LAETWRSFEAVKTEKSTWGDEVEYVVVRLDHEAQELHVSPRSSQILNALKARYPEGLFDLEAYKYMLESQPQRPYGNSLQELGQVESNIRDRYVRAWRFEVRVLTQNFLGDRRSQVAYQGMKKYLLWATSEYSARRG
jgi:gamma-glutamyl:cysteine ligase YbdK (ATP-grasp superfamily)